MPETLETQETLVRVVVVVLVVRRHIRLSQVAVVTARREVPVKGLGLVQVAMRKTWITVIRVLLARVVQAELQEQALLQVGRVVRERLV